MRALIYYVATSLDGFIADPSGGFDAFTQQGDHLTRFFEALPRFGAVLMGRTTYEVGLAAGMTDPYPMIPRSIVISTTLTAPDPRIEVVNEDAIGRVRRLKFEAEGPIWLCGGSILAGHLWEAGLIDELWLKQNPLLLGDGIPLFAGARLDPTALQLKDVQRFESGVCELRYAVTSRRDPSTRRS